IFFQQRAAGVGKGSQRSQTEFTSFEHARVNRLTCRVACTSWLPPAQQGYQVRSVAYPRTGGKFRECVEHASTRCRGTRMGGLGCQWNECPVLVVLGARQVWLPGEW